MLAVGTGRVRQCLEFPFNITKINGSSLHLIPCPWILGMQTVNPWSPLMPVIFWAQSLCYSSTDWTKTLLRTPGFLVKTLLDLTCQRVRCHFLQIVARHLSYCLSYGALPFFPCRTLRSLLPPSRVHLREGAPITEKRSDATCCFKIDLGLVHGHNAGQWGSHPVQLLVPPVSFRLPIALWRSLANRSTVEKAKFWLRKDVKISLLGWKAAFP